MDENQVTENQVVNENDLKDEATKTFNEAKEQMKNIDFKEEAKAGKGLLLKIWKNPFSTIQEVINEDKNRSFKTALLLVAVWAIISVVDLIIGWIKYGMYVKDAGDVFGYIFKFIGTAIGPVLTIVAMTLVIYFMNKGAKKPIAKTLTATIVAYIPMIVADLVSLLTLISSKAYYVTSPVKGFLRAMSLVFLYFVTKGLAEKENDEEGIKFFIKVQAVFYIVSFALNFLDISI